MVVFSIGLRQIMIPRLDPTVVLHSAAATDRLQLLHAAVRLIAAHPLVGIGAGNYSIAEAGSPLASTLVQPVHVVPLLVAAESGILAGVAWLALLTVVPVMDWRDSGIKTIRGTQRFAVPVVLLILASLDHYFWTFAPGQALFWVTMGIWASRSDVGTVPEMDDSRECLGDLSDSSPGEREVLLATHNGRRHDESRKTPPDSLWRGSVLLLRLACQIRKFNRDFCADD